MSSSPASAAASRRSASVLPARAGPAIVTRDPRPNGVSHSIALTVGSSEPSRKRSLGNAAGRSSKRGPSATSSAGRPLIVSTPDHRGEPLGPARRSPGTRDPVAGHELAALDLRRRDVHVILGGLGRVDAQEARAVRQQLDLALYDLVLVGTLGGLPATARPTGSSISSVPTGEGSASSSRPDRGRPPRRPRRRRVDGRSSSSSSSSAASRSRSSTASSPASRARSSTASSPASRSRSSTASSPASRSRSSRPPRRLPDPARRRPPRRLPDPPRRRPPRRLPDPPRQRPRRWAPRPGER